MSSPDLFPSVTYDQWRARVESELKGADFDRRLVTRLPGGVEIQPLYCPEHPGALPGPAGASPFVRGTSSAPRRWAMRQRIELDDIDASAKAIAAEQGVSHFTLALQDGVRPGVRVQSEADLRQLLADVEPESVALHLDAGRGSFPAAAWLARCWEEHTAPRGGFGLDPLALLADQGHLAIHPHEAWALTAELARWALGRGGGVRAVRIDSAPWHDAGADAVTDLAAALAGGVAALRGLSDAGLSLEQACAQIEVSLRLGPELFLEIARIRAFRALWSRMTEACGLSSVGEQAHLHVQLGERALTRRDPWVNILRNTVACFAGAVAGADAITSLPFDGALGQPSDLGRRLARNTQHLLAEESHLARVVDPAGGSWFVEDLTEQLAEKAWGVFRQIEAEGGLEAAIRSGSLRQRVDATWAERRQDLDRRKAPITGVSEFPLADEALLERAPAEAERPGAAALLDALTRAMAQPGGWSDALSGQLEPLEHGEGARVRPFPLRRFAEAFEALRDESDRRLADEGARPSVFLALLGSLAQVNARAAWTRSLLEAGGLAVVDGPLEADDDAILEAWAASGATRALICGPDALYPERAEALARRLVGAGAAWVGFAGRPGELEPALREAGVAEFVYIGVDVVALLEALQAVEVEP